MRHLAPRRRSAQANRSCLEHSPAPNCIRCMSTACPSFAPCEHWSLCLQMASPDQDALCPPLRKEGYADQCDERPSLHCGSQEMGLVSSEASSWTRKWLWAHLSFLSVPSTIRCSRGCPCRQSFAPTIALLCEQIHPAYY